MGRWINEVLKAIKEKKELPQIDVEEDVNEEMDEDVFSEELGSSEN